MNDLISRKALIAEYDRVHIGPPGGARKLMEDAPAVATDNNVGHKWIPVTERLPEKHDRYLVLTPSPFGHKDYTPWLAWYEPEVGFIDSDPEYGDLEMDDVTHWMPIPELPKEERP